MQIQIGRRNCASPLQAPTSYPRLSDLTVKVQSSEEAAGLLPCITPASLPALRRLTLVAGAGAAGVSADLSTLDHPALTSLLLHGITLEGGFSSLQHLAGGLPRPALRWAAPGLLAHHGAAAGRPNPGPERRVWRPFIRHTPPRPRSRRPVQPVPRV